MASNRHLGRIVALQTLYEQDFRHELGDHSFVLSTTLKRNIRHHRATLEDTRFVHIIVDGVDARRDQLDAVLQPLAPEWPIREISRVDRVILRIGAYELLHVKDVPSKVVINEAVELGKTFGGESSSKFVNGVLGTLLRSIDKNADPKPIKPNEARAKQASS